MNNKLIALILIIISFGKINCQEEQLSEEKLEGMIGQYFKLIGSNFESDPESTDSLMRNLRRVKRDGYHSQFYRKQPKVSEVKDNGKYFGLPSRTGRGEKNFDTRMTPEEIASGAIGPVAFISNTMIPVGIQVLKAKEANYVEREPNRNEPLAVASIPFLGLLTNQVSGKR